MTTLPGLPKRSFTARTKADIPSEPHYAILTFSSVYVPGDERSRTAPGHGYPAHHEDVMTYTVFLDEPEFKV
jgi:hypothetical protein